MESIYVFMGKGATMPTAIYTTFEDACTWVASSAVSGILYKLPMNVSLYDWVIAKGYSTPKKEYQKQPRFIEKFSSAYVEHWHFENG